MPIGRASTGKGDGGRVPSALGLEEGGGPAKGRLRWVSSPPRAGMVPSLLVRQPKGR